MSAPDSVVIVGSGQGGFQVAASLRDEGYAGPITLLGEEPGLPYGRPPLSKAYLTGKTDEAALRLRGPNFFADHRVTLRDGERAVAIERDRHVVRLASGDEIPYGHLVLATGARNRALPWPGHELAKVVQLRSLADADAIRTGFDRLRSVVVIGAGFIGLEVAAVLAGRGVAVTVLEATSRPMPRAVSLPTSSFFAAAHARAGIQLEFGAVVTRIDGRAGAAVAVETSDGRAFPADLVLVAIGVVPNVELAAEAGLAVANGIVVDAELRTADPAISAIGDCAAYPSVHAGGAPTRLESVQNAVDHARCVAARLVGRPAPYAAVPWFWSDQGALKLQIAGLPLPHEAAVVRGDPAEGAFSVFCYEGGRLTSVESVNRPADHMMARRLMAKGFEVSPAEAADPSFDLKAHAHSLLAAA